MVDVDSLYDSDYYNNGLATRKSCYQDYRWLPEQTIVMAYNMIKYLKLSEYERVLDYGCAMGYLVKALRLLDIPAYGCDISSYAIQKVDADVRDYCSRILTDSHNPFELDFDWIITKDVLEHIDEGQIDIFLNESREYAHKMFHVIPLGDEDHNFIIKAYHDDPSHIQVNSKKWWIDKFNEFGWRVLRFDYSVRGIKENWTDNFPKGNGFFVLEKMTLCE